MNTPSAPEHFAPLPDSTSDAAGLEQLMTGNSSEAVTGAYPVIGPDTNPPTDTTPQAPEAVPGPSRNDVRRHRAPSSFTPSAVAGRIKSYARTHGVNLESIRRKLPYVAAVGSLAVTAATVYVGVRHGIDLPDFLSSHRPHNHDAAQWHNPTADTAAAGNETPAGGAPELPTTTETTVDKSLLVGAQDADTRQAFAHDVNLEGHSSSVSGWSEQAIENSALKAGLTHDQAHALAQDPNNVELANKAFYGDNSAVAEDPHHYMNADDSYNIHGQNQAADDLVKQWKAEHMPEPAAPADNGSASAQEQTGADNGGDGNIPGDQPGGNGESTERETVPAVPPAFEENNAYLEKQAELIARVGYAAAALAIPMTVAGFAAAPSIRKRRAARRARKQAAQNIVRHRARRGHKPNASVNPSQKPGETVPAETTPSN